MVIVAIVVIMTMITTGKITAPHCTAIYVCPPPDPAVASNWVFEWMLLFWRPISEGLIVLDDFVLIQGTGRANSLCVFV
jgi:hypothetical protein